MKTKTSAKIIFFSNVGKIKLRNIKMFESFCVFLQKFKKK